MDRAKKIEKYEMWAKIVKMFRPDIKMPIQDMAVMLAEADENRMIEQKKIMQIEPRKSTDVQRILDIGR